MARLPQPGSDAGEWGTILNDFLTQAHNTNGTLKDNSVSAAQLAPNSVQTSSIADDAITNAKLDTATKTSISKADTAVQPSSLATVATSGVYNDLTSKPTLGSAASLNIGTTAGTVAAGDDSRITSAVPATRTVAGHPLSSDVTITPGDIGAATAAQGTLATTAVQPGQIISSGKKIAGLTYFAVSSRSFPALVRPPEPGRGRLVIRNVGTNNVNVVVANRTVANYNSPGWTGAISVTAGKELIADSSSSDLFIGPDADGTLIKVKVYAEVNV